MSKILQGEMLNQFINECFKEFEEDIVNVIIVLGDKISKCIINGHRHINIDRAIIEKYMYNENKSL